MNTIKKFSELEKSADPKVRKASIVRKMTVAVKGIQASNKKADIIINKVHKAFADEKRVFTPVQVKKAILAFKKMNKVLSRHIKRDFSMLRVAIKSEIPNDTIASQLENLYALKGKIALLYAQLTGSLAEEYDDDEILEDDEDEFVELDESGYVVDEEDPVEEIIEEEPMTDDEAADETASEETASEETVADETIADETAADETAADETAADETAADETAADETAETTADKDLVDDDIVEDVIEDVIEDVVEDVVDEEVVEDVIEEELEEIDIELEEDGIDEALAGEIFGQEDDFIDFDDVDDEIDATAALKNKKIASAKRTQGNSGLSEDGILTSLMEQELVI